MKKLTTIILAFFMVFTMGIKPNVIHAEGSTFTDVSEDAWYYDAVNWAVENNITSGVSKTQFAPNAQVTRAQTVTFLWRLAGSPEPTTTTNPFTDVSDSGSMKPFYNAILWAYENGITAGTSKTLFSPNATCTRAQIVTFLHRYAGRPEHTTQENPFKDVTNTGSMAPFYDPILWAAENGITVGNRGLFSPNSTCTRAEVVTFLYRYANLKTEEPVETYDIKIGDTTITLGQDISTLGEPDEIISGSIFGYSFYVYGTNDYRNFYAVGVVNNTVGTVIAAGPGFEYNGMTCGSQDTGAPEDAAYYATIMTDKNDNNIVHAVFLSQYYPKRTVEITPEVLNDESKMNFHLTNAFRAYHNANKLTWSNEAATAAHLHSQDMADNDYFSHTSQDGRTFDQRLKEQNISFWMAGENIDYGGASFYSFEHGGLQAYNDWVNSSGHRQNMLTPEYKHLGVGGGYIYSNYYKYYFTQDFFSN